MYTSIPSFSENFQTSFSCQWLRRRYDSLDTVDDWSATCKWPKYGVGLIHLWPVNDNWRLWYTLCAIHRKIMQYPRFHRCQWWTSQKGSNQQPEGWITFTKMSLEAKLQEASQDFQKLQVDLSNAVEARQQLDAQLAENELVKKARLAWSPFFPDTHFITGIWSIKVRKYGLQVSWACTSPARSIWSKD